ncbi:hypothetical protein [Actinophytocola oryzae]|uniref:hypothetical protein n=1 Tax=Actinophytocola oryzae TaxID=502181 RepID=UPI001063D8C7|nr:hypothetical protein [Actinophytocola oryzae]
MKEPWPGFALDADEYVRVLPEIEADLPEGARRFALDTEHYNFFGSRCVKDLKLSSMTIVDAADELSVKLLFAPNRFKHDQGLAIMYSNAVVINVDVAASPRMVNVQADSRRLGDLQLDEILPHEKGMSHELKFTGGTVRIIAADLFAEWSEESVENS